jgi:hypothetical protein
MDSIFVGVDISKDSFSADPRTNSLRVSIATSVGNPRVFWQVRAFISAFTLAISFLEGRMRGKDLYGKKGVVNL